MPTTSIHQFLARNIQYAVWQTDTAQLAEGDVPTQARPSFCLGARAHFAVAAFASFLYRIFGKHQAGTKKKKGRKKKEKIKRKKNYMPVDGESLMNQ